MEFHERVRHQYLALADSEADRIVVIDGVGTEDQVFSEIRGVLKNVLMRHSRDCPKKPQKVLAC